ncbi:DUF1642 domain-containing protein [Lactococcus allomyrinae]|uniref:DUF1642 domain-containing protein n=1 Tax=Lactococcus allomyrinae TaxID=2419773 RepID=A0A387BCS8_9LACT|nr:DUF1642 domain-containing protein [Lactococcus allomyrinae]AYG01685.1 DUF1642 domain-containing protein [Lactococcus allomyrinae]
MTNAFEEIYAPATEPVTIANNANQALYKNHRQWREYAQALKEQNDELKAIALAHEEVYQELLDKNEQLIDDRLKMLKEIEVLRSQFKQQALPIVPQFAADWIEYHKANVEDEGVYDAMSRVWRRSDSVWNKKHVPEQMEDWLGENENENEFCLAYVLGYTVEEPKALVSPCPICGYEGVESNFCSICGHKNEYVEVE